MNSAVRLVGVLAVVCLCTDVDAGAQSIWSGLGDGTSWSDANNWSPVGVPGPATNAVLDNNATVVVDVASNVGSVSVSGLFAVLEIQNDLSVAGGFSQSIASSTVSGEADLTIGGLLEWSGGTQSGTGSTIAAGGILFSGSAGSASFNKILDGRRLVVPSGTTAEYAGTNSFQAGNGAVIEIQTGAFFDLTEWTRFAVFSGSTAPPVVENDGLFRKVGGTASADILFDFVNRGTVEVALSRLSLEGLLVDSDGAYRASEGAELRIASPSPIVFGAGSVIEGSGTAHFAWPTVATLSGTYAVTGRTKVGGSGSISRADVDFQSGMNLQDLGSYVDLGDGFNGGGVLRLNTSSPVSVDSVTIGGWGELLLTPSMTVVHGVTLGNQRALIAGPGDVTVKGLLTWAGGVMRGPGVTVAEGGVAVIGDRGSASWSKTLDGRRLILPAGTVGDYLGSYGLVGSNDAVLEIQAGAEFNVTSWPDFTLGSGVATIENAGIVRKSGLDSRIAWSLANSDTVAIADSRLIFLGDLTNGQSGVITGRGEIDVSRATSFQNLGTLAPGLPHGTLDITVPSGGALQLASPSIVDIQFGSTGALPGQDTLRVSGSVVVGGDLHVSTLPTYSGNGSMEGAVVLWCDAPAPCLTGAFESVVTDGSAGASVAYTDTSVVLTLEPLVDVPIRPVPSVSSAALGEEFVVDIEIGSEAVEARDLFGVAVRLDFDPAIEFASAEAGSLLYVADPGAFTFFSRYEPGSVAIAASRNRPLPGVTGYGTVASIRLRVPAGMGARRVPFTLQEVLLVDPGGTPLGFATGSAEMQVTETPGPVSVWPGDTNADGLVDETDIFPLGNCFGIEGDARAGELDLSWNPHPVEGWGFLDAGPVCTTQTTPDPAHADATGDGRIDQNDVLPIGVHFGRTMPSGPPPEPPGTLATTVVLPQPVGTEILVDLVHECPDTCGPVRGIAARFSVPAGLDVIESSAESLDDGDLVAFERGNHETDFSFAFTRKGEEEAASIDGPLMSLRLRVAAEMDFPAEVVLLSAVVSRADNVPVRLLDGVSLAQRIDVGVGAPEVGLVRFALSEPYPNPFGQRTTISYDVPEPARVTIDLFDALGRRVAVLVDADLPVGRFEADIDGERLSRGIYFVRMRSREYAHIVTAVHAD
jgi:hypothetical protein